MVWNIDFPPEAGAPELALELPPGRGHELRDDMRALVEELARLESRTTGKLDSPSNAKPPVPEPRRVASRSDSTTAGMSVCHSG